MAEKYSILYTHTHTHTHTHTPFSIHLSADGDLGYFHIPGYCKKYAMKIGVHVSLELIDLFSLGIYPGVKFLDYMVALILVF